MALCLAACAGQAPLPPAATAEPRIADNVFLTRDGLLLPAREWAPPGRPIAGVVALHGFTDYSNAFAIPATYWAGEGIATFAFDQRGFGGAPDPGLFAGEAPMVTDAVDAVAAMRRRYPGIPVYLMGESMGGAVAILAAAGPAGPHADGTILVSPGIWGGESLDWPMRATLWTLNGVVPEADLTMPHELYSFRPTDDYRVMRSMSADPLVQKGARIDMLAGVTRLLGDALADAPRLDSRTLVLYGRHDEVLPESAIGLFLGRLKPPGKGGPRVAIYDEGYHELFRDLERQVAIEDVGAHLRDPRKPLPSGADRPAPWYEVPHE